MIKREVSGKKKRFGVIAKGIYFPKKNFFQYILNNKNMLYLNNDTKK